MERLSPSDSVRRALIGRAPLLYLITSDEERALRLVEPFRSRLVRDATLDLTSWSCVSGFSDEPADARTLDPVAAVERVRDGTDPGFWVLHDFEVFLDRPQVRRALREAYATLRGKERYLFLTGYSGSLPQELEKDIHVIDLGLPDESELRTLVETFCRSYSGLTLGEEVIVELGASLRGLTLNQAFHTLHRIFRSRKLGREDIFGEVFRDRAAVVRQAGYLDFVPPDIGVDQIGGLENLKAWLARRKGLFNLQAVNAGMPVPKGMLIMGMSGCGKSLAAKAVSSHWGAPLFRLDMNLVASGLYGTPEAAFARALSAIEGLAPAVLWIDEIENALGMDEESRGGANPRIFSSFLTWMQEKPPLIFVAATANRISALPAEVIRKGRFDQVFFVDLPTLAERGDIFRIHLGRNGADLEQFDLELLSIATKGWNGAEIEQAVVAARVDAYNETRPFTMRDLTRNTSTTVPLSRTMHEQMKKIRSWAFGRATLASSEAFTEAERAALG
ncbi:MAG TPA: AAA family ATPase [Thermoanaerobaculia bacterium]|nr:AAA family ATPase [Thermoanaerobaculia bacterium]